MLNILNNVRIKNKLLLSYIIVLIIPIFVIGYFLTNKLTTLSFSSTKQLSYATAKQIQENILNKFSTYKDIVDTITNDATIMKYIDTIYDNDYTSYDDYVNYISPLIKRSNNTDIYTSIKIYTNNTTIGFSGVTNNIISDLKNKSWYDKKAALTGKLIWAKMDNVENNGIKYLCCYKAINDINHIGSFKAIIQVMFDEAKLYSLISEEKNGGKMIFLYDDKGTIITTTERNSLFQPISTIQLEGNRPITAAKDNSIVKYLGNRYQFFILPFSDAGNSIENWHLLYLIPARHVESDINSIWSATITISIVCFILSFCIIIILSNNITRRTNNLIDKIRKIWDGDFKVSMQVSGTDEIGILESNFQKMVSKIDTLIREVYEAKIISQKIQMEKKDAELIALKGQINPHYLYNTLESIRMNLVKANEGKTAEIVKIFAESFRTLIETKNDLTSLKSELGIINKYFIIQKYRYGDKIELIVDIPNELLNCKIPTLIIQPLVENAVYHGIEMKPGQGVILIKSFETEGKLHISVMDDGVGIDEDELDIINAKISGDAALDYSNDWRGVALKNIQNRIKLMFGQDFGLQISSKKGRGTVAEITIPVIQ